MSRSPVGDHKVPARASASSRKSCCMSHSPVLLERACTSCPEHGPCSFFLWTEAAGFSSRDVMRLVTVWTSGTLAVFFVAPALAKIQRNASTTQGLRMRKQHSGRRGSVLSKGALRSGPRQRQAATCRRQRDDCYMPSPTLLQMLLSHFSVAKAMITAHATTWTQCFNSD